MRLTSLSIQSVRRIDNAQLKLSPRTNFLYGENGSGKTSLLEAIYYLSSGRSFRTNRVAEVISHGQSALMVRGELAADDDLNHTIGIEKTSASTRFRLNGQPLTVASHAARLVPLLVFNSESASLLDGGPSNRRALLDRLLFHVEPRYFEELKTLYRNLKQRNALLRSGAPTKEISAWNEQLVSVSEQMDARRAECVIKLNDEILQGGLAEFVGGLTLEYRRGWSAEHGYAEVLEENERRDREIASTSAGPHRAELRIRLDGKGAKSVVSRGQGKIIIASLIAAQAAYLCANGAETPILLIDDLASELDRSARTAAVKGLLATGTQLFFTAIEASDLPIEANEDGAMFHVEHGRLTSKSEPD